MKTKVTEMFSPGGAITVKNIDFLKILSQSFDLFESKRKVPIKRYQNRAVYADEWCLGHSKNATEFFTLDA